MSSRPMCPLCSDWIPAVLDAEPAGLTESLAKHAEDCIACRQYWAAASWLRTALEQWPEPEPAQSPRSIADKVLADRQDRLGERMRAWLAASLTLVVLALACLISLDEPVLRAPMSELAEATISSPANTNLTALPSRLPEPLPGTSPAISLARTSQSEGESASDISETGTYAIREVAHWFVPDPVRRSVEDVWDLVSPVLAMSWESVDSVTLSDLVPAPWLGIGQLWNPLWDAGHKGLRLFQQLVPAIPDQPNL